VKIVKSAHQIGRYNQAVCRLEDFCRKSEPDTKGSLTIVWMSVETCYQKGDTSVAKKKAKKKAKKAARKKK
jgi:hypothetical protein